MPGKSVDLCPQPLGDFAVDRPRRHVTTQVSVKNRREPGAPGSLQKRGKGRTPSYFGQCRKTNPRNCEVTHRSAWRQSLWTFGFECLIGLEQIHILRWKPGKCHHGGTYWKAEVPVLRGAGGSLAIGDRGAVYTSGASQAILCSDRGNPGSERTGGCRTEDSEF